MSVLYTDPFWLAELDDTSVVRLRRTSERIESMDDMQASLDALATALRTAAQEHQPCGILLDTRAAPPRNDGDFENMTTRYRVDLERVFKRVVTLVGTEVGKLQMARLDRRDGTQSVVFDDEVEALAFLRR